MATSEFKPHGVIYCIEHIATGRRYIGQTRGCHKKRWKNHLSDKSGCPLLKNAVEKYGPEAFTITVLDSAPDSDALNELEVYYIGLFKTTQRAHGFNVLPGGLAGPQPPDLVERRAAALRGKKLTEDHRAKLSMAHMGHRRSSESIAKQIATVTGTKRKPHTPEAKLRISLAHKGRPGRKLSEEAKAKIGDAQRGKKDGPLPPEQRQKIAEALRGVPKNISPEGKARMADMLKNRVITDETRKKMSDSHKGMVQSAETIEKRAAAHRGRKNTEETKEKMRAAALARWARLRVATN